MRAAFGAPIDSVLVSDGIGPAFSWRVGSSGVWRTYASAQFGQREAGCSAFVSLVQTTGPADLLK
jgi:hypothetical protein